MENQTLEENPEEEGQETSEETLKETPEGTPENSSEETSKETVEEETKTIDYEAKFKASQKEALKLKAELDSLKKKSTPKGEDSLDTILEVQQATKGLDPTQIAELKVRAKANDVSLLEARKDPNFELWNAAYLEKVEKDKQALKPSSKQGLDKTEKPLKEMTLDEKAEYFAKRGFVKEFPKPRTQ